MVSQAGKQTTIRLKENALFEEASETDLVFRRLEWADFDKGFLEALKGLTEVGSTTKQQFMQRFDELFPRLQDMYKIIVIEDVRKQRIIGAGSVILESKFIRNLGLSGHIEDIVVDKSYRGKNLGRRIIELLKLIAEINGCYKVILDCSEQNVAFYKKCGFKVKGAEMAWYVN